MNFNTYLLSIISTIEHYICRTPSDLHINEKLERVKTLAQLNLLEELLALRRWSSLELSEKCLLSGEGFWKAYLYTDGTDQSYFITMRCRDIRNMIIWCFRVIELGLAAFGNESLGGKVDNVRKASGQYISLLQWLQSITYRMWRLLVSNRFPVFFWYQFANSESIVSLLDALSQVIWPI